MPNQGRGVFSKDVDGDLVFYRADETAVATIDGTTGLLTLAAGIAITGDVGFHATAGSKFGFGALETPTIATGVLTVTKPFVNPLPESSTTDQVDSIVYTGAAQGDLLLIHVPATNTITFDDANINLAAATRAVAPGGSLLLVYDGSQWSEVLFVAATDNA